MNHCSTNVPRKDTTFPVTKRVCPYLCDRFIPNPKEDGCLGVSLVDSREYPKPVICVMKDVIT